MEQRGIVVVWHPPQAVCVARSGGAAVQIRVIAPVARRGPAILLHRRRPSLGILLSQSIPRIPVALIERGVLPYPLDQRGLLGQDLVLALIGVVLPHAFDLGLHDDPAHLGGISLRLGGLIVLRVHGMIDRLPDILLLGVLQPRLPGPDGLVRLSQPVALQPVLLLRQPCLPGLIVPFAHPGI